MKLVNYVVDRTLMLGFLILMFSPVLIGAMLTLYFFNFIKYDIWFSLIPMFVGMVVNIIVFDYMKYVDI